MSKKIHVVGQGIDINKFLISSSKSLKDKSGPFKIISVGRISPVKDYETLISAAEILRNAGLDFIVDIVGGAGLARQEEYFSDLKNLVDRKELGSVVNFLGAKPNNEIKKYLETSDLFVNTSRTGSLDKAVLEAMAVGLPVLTCNEALLEVLGDYKDKLMFEKGDSTGLAAKVKWVAGLSFEDRKKMGEDLRNIVVRDHSLKHFVSKILGFYHTL